MAAFPGISRAERLPFVAQIREGPTESDKARQTARASTYENFELAVFDLLATIMLEHMAGNNQSANRSPSGPDLRMVIFSGLIEREHVQVP